MQGSIRALVGFLIAFGAVGGMDNGAPIGASIVVAVIGLLIMASGIQAMNR